MSAPAPTVLVVEDHTSLREFLREVLQALGYGVLAAESTGAAVTLWREHQDLISLLIADLELPGGSGLDLCRELVADRPDLPTLLISGHGLEQIDETKRQDICGFLHKPFSMEELAGAVRDCVAQP